MNKMIIADYEKIHTITPNVEEVPFPRLHVSQGQLIKMMKKASRKKALSYDGITN